MARVTYEDFEGAWWHVTNRGLAKRTVFENEYDIVRFEEFLLRLCELGLLEVHAYVFLTNHFHLLLRSPAGQLSEGMRLLTNFYVRWFNRTRKRDGALFRGRFWRKRIDDPLYWETVLRYIDLNAVRARICDRPADYPHSSAYAYVHGSAPGYLVTQHVMQAVATWASKAAFEPADYEPYALIVDPDLVAHIVERTLRHPRNAPLRGFDDLVRAASLRQQGWMEWKARLADGVPPGAVWLAPKTVDRVVARAGHIIDFALPQPHARSATTRVLRAGLLRHECALRLREVAAQLGVVTSTAHRLVARDRALLLAPGPYADLRARILAVALRTAFPASSRSPLALPRPDFTPGSKK